MALGQAFVEVHADLTPFRRDLARELQRATREFERQLNQTLQVQLQRTAEQAGGNAGRRFSESFNRSTRDTFGNRQASPWVALVGTLAGALDDGISALPVQLKAAIVAGLIGISPLIAGALSAAITAGAGLAFVGVGVALASQFQAVQTGWQQFISRMRVLFVDAAGGFQDAVLNTLSLIEARAAELAPALKKIFDTASTFLEPFVGHLIDALDVFLFHMESVIGQSGDFIDELGRGIVTLADTLGFVLSLLASTGEDGRKALRDLIAIVAILVVGFAQMLVVLTKIYGFIRNLAQFIADMPVLLQVLTPHLALLGHVTKGIDGVSGANEAWFHTNVELVDSQGRVITRTKEEEDALKTLTNAIKDAADATLGAITSNVSYERSIDNLEDALKRGGRNLDITTKKGQDTVESFARAISGLREQLAARVQAGQLSSDQAIAQYNREIERIETLGNKAGITDQKFRELFGIAIQLGQLEIAPETAGVDAATASVETLIARIQRAIAVARGLSSIVSLIPGTGLTSAALRAAGFADGGVIDRPTVMMAGEGNRREVVIPLTKPARAAELMRQTGLDQMSGGQQVLVFIDGKQMDARMVMVAKSVTAQQGVALAQGFRGM